ncbi:MAG: PKD domain-containing protein [Armatimonadetes bacterium]|nr:PKD domain-containing protein [Armatimonadota bacterium]
MRGGGGAAGGAAAAARTEPVTSAKTFTARNVRLVLFTDKGQLVADAVPIGVLPKDEKGWVPVAVSLAAMKGATDATQVRAVGVFTDESEVFYLGRVRLLVDNRPVEVTAKAEPLFTLPGQVVEFEASLRGGLIEPNFSWDFDRRDGIQAQALGEKVKFVFKEPGDYIITCTVTDKAGVQSPSKDEVGVKVEEVEAVE